MGAVAPLGVKKIIYRPIGGAHKASDPVTFPFQNENAHARGVYAALKTMRHLKPDLIVAHSGFGSSVFLRLLYDAPIINYFEYYFHLRQGITSAPGCREIPLEQRAQRSELVRGLHLLNERDQLSRAFAAVKENLLLD